MLYVSIEDVHESLTKLIPVVINSINDIRPSVQNLIIPNWSCNDSNITVLNLSRFSELRAIEIGDHCFTSVTKFQINGLSKLNSLKIGSYSFSSDNPYIELLQLVMPIISNDGPSSFHVLNCKSLQTIEIGDNSFSSYAGQFELRKLPNLQLLRIGNVGQRSCNFMDCSFEIRCNHAIGWMRNSSSQIEDHYIV